jgi:hypothetical protein
MSLWFVKSDLISQSLEKKRVYREAVSRLRKITEFVLTFVRCDEILLQCDMACSCRAALLGRFLPRLGPPRQRAALFSVLPNAMEWPGLGEKKRSPARGCALPVRGSYSAASASG